MGQQSKVAKPILLIIGISLLGKLLGFLREALIGSKFGANQETDAFFIALSAIALFSSLIIASLNTTAIPVLSLIDKIEGKKGKAFHTNNLIFIVVIISVLLVILAFLFAPTIIHLLAPGFETEQVTLAILLMRIALPTIILAGLQGVLRGYLQSEGQFSETAAVTFPFNFVYVFYLLFLSSLYGIKGLIVAHVLSQVAIVFMQVLNIRRLNFKFAFVFKLDDIYVKQMFSLLPPVLLSIGIADVNSIIDKSMASSLVSGSISALNYANKLNGLVTGIFISAITTVLYPSLASAAQKDNPKELKSSIVNGINLMLLVNMPAIVGMVILAKPIVKAAFQRGVFDTTATAMTAGALVFTVVGLVGFAIRALMNYVFYSLQDTKTPMFVGLFGVIVNVILNLLLIKPMAHEGLALATSVSAIASALLLLYLLRKKIGSFGFKAVYTNGLKIVASSLVMGLVVFFVYNLLVGVAGGRVLFELVVLGLSVLIGAIVYFVGITLLGVTEAKQVVGLVRGKVKGLSKGAKR